MIITLGKIGRIAEIYHDNDLKVEVCGNCWTYNPLSVQKINTNALNNGSLLNSTNGMNKFSATNSHSNNTSDGLRDILKHLYESHVSGNVTEDLGKKKDD